MTSVWRLGFCRGQALLFDDQTGKVSLSWRLWHLSQAGWCLLFTPGKIIWHIFMALRYPGSKLYSVSFIFCQDFAYYVSFMITSSYLLCRSCEEPEIQESSSSGPSLHDALIGKIIWVITAESGKQTYWSIGPLVYWSVGPLVPWSIGLLVHWPIGPLAHWSIGPLVHWSIGPLVPCLIGPLVHCSINSLVHWSIGPSIHWSIGPLVLWSIDPLVHWSIGPLVH